MSDKLKTPPQNPLAYLWSEFLFARPFAYTTSLAPDECQKALYRLAESGGDWMNNAATRTVDIQPGTSTHSKQYHFDIRIRRNNWSAVSYTMAKATGTMSQDSAGTTTLVQGRVQFGTSYYVLNLVVVVMMVLLLVNFSSVIKYDTSVLFPIILSFVFAGFFWWQMYGDRNRLALLIGATLHGVEHSRTEKLKRDQSSSVDAALLPADEQEALRKQK